MWRKKGCHVHNRSMFDLKRSPGLSVNNRNRYKGERKAKFRILLMAKCNKNWHIVCFNISCPHTTHDSLASIIQTIGNKISKDALINPFYTCGQRIYGLLMRYYTMKERYVLFWRTFNTLRHDGIIELFVGFKRCTWLTENIPPIVHMTRNCRCWNCE